ncbi:MAG TPA: TIGR03943 family protein [Roseiflexaceae bacterium]|nr:TIGR03943 family protein [Roseiflexaceae bacterium]HMP41191.1 TIGR03943 family protein [Roseiflexaceae bacterium]
MAVDTVQPADRPINWAALIETALLGSLAAMLLTKVLRGVMIFYIHPRYTPLVAAAALVVALLAYVRMRAIFESAAEPLGKRAVAYAALALAVALGTLVPARPLGAGTLSSSGLDAGRSANADLIADGRTAEWDLLQWSIAFSIYGAGEPLLGSPVDVVGFVFYDAQLAGDGFIVARYVISCCTADGSGAGMPVAWQGGVALPTDSWVRVRGTLGARERNGIAEPILLAESIEPVAQPRNPYLYATR